MSVPTILIVGDDPDGIALLCRQLGPEQYNTICLDNGPHALEEAQANPDLDLILLDVSMPGMDGIEVCRALRSCPQTASIPIVLVSKTKTDEASIQRGLEAGADGYLAKPIEDVALRAWVKAALHISRLQHELTEHSPDVPPTQRELLKVFAGLSRAVNPSLQALYAAADILAHDLPEKSPDRNQVTEICTYVEKVAEIIASASLMARNSLEK